MNETQHSMNDLPAQEGNDSLWVSRCDVFHRAYVTYRYHRRRQKFFDVIDKTTKALTLALGFTLFGQWFKDAVPVLASGISLLSLLALLFAYSDRKQTHKELAECAMNLIEKIESTASKSLSSAAVSGWWSDLMRLNAKEPPALKTLVILCEIEEAISRGHTPNHIPRPGIFKRLVADFI